MFPSTGGRRGRVPQHAALAATACDLRYHKLQARHRRAFLKFLEVARDGGPAEEGLQVDGIVVHCIFGEACCERVELACIESGVKLSDAGYSQAL